MIAYKCCFKLGGVKNSLLYNKYERNLCWMQTKKDVSVRGKYKISVWTRTLNGGYKKAPYSKLGDHLIEGDFVVMTQSKGQFNLFIYSYTRKKS
jgi:hypothetical protein